MCAKFSRLHRDEARPAVEGLRRAACRLIKLLAHPDHNVAWRARSEVRRLGRFGVARMAAVLERADDPALRFALVRALGWSGATDPRTAYDALLRAERAAAKTDVALLKEIDDGLERLSHHIPPRHGG
jgi:hypothetical protein